VTSAETVLIQQQSYQRLLDKIDSNRDSNNQLVIVVAISPNSRASIAHFLGMNASECFLRIASVLKSLGVMYVVDAAAAGDVALMEAREEFVMRCSLYCL
jgi:iron only hydrogenase large subunit-like protein